MIPTVNHFIGQQDVVARFRVALEACWNDHGKLPHMLFVGGPGLGKTELAHLAAREMGVEIHERLAQTLISPGAIVDVLFRDSLNQTQAIRIERRVEQKLNFGEIDRRNPCRDVRYRISCQVRMTDVRCRVVNASEIRIRDLGLGVSRQLQAQRDCQGSQDTEELPHGVTWF